MTPPVSEAGGPRTPIPPSGFGHALFKKSAFQKGALQIWRSCFSNLLRSALYSDIILSQIGTLRC